MIGGIFIMNFLPADVIPMVGPIQYTKWNMISLYFVYNGNKSLSRSRLTLFQFPILFIVNFDK